MTLEEITTLMAEHQREDRNANFVVLVGGYRGVAMWSTEPNEQAKAIIQYWNKLLVVETLISGCV